MGVLPPEGPPAPSSNAARTRHPANALSHPHTHSPVPPVPQPHAVHTEPAGPPLRTRTEEQESFEMRMDFGLAQGEQMKPKLTATEERRRRRSESSGGRAPGHEGVFGGLPTPFLKYLVLKYAAQAVGPHCALHPPPQPVTRGIPGADTRSRVSPRARPGDRSAPGASAPAARGMCSPAPGP